MNERVQQLNRSVGKWRLRGLIALAVIVLVVLPITYGALMLWADLTVNQLFFDSLGMGSAHSTIIRSYLAMLAVGILMALAIAVPFLAVGRPVAGTNGPRLQALAAAGGVALFGMLILIPAFTGQRNDILAALNAVPFGVDDPVFGRDVSFFIFTAPVVTAILWSLMGALLIATIAAAALLMIGIRGRHGSEIIPGIAGVGPLRITVLAARGQTMTLVYGGLTLMTFGAALWWTRFSLVSGDGELIAGAGEAMRTVGIPTQTVVSIGIGIFGLALVALAVPRVRERTVAITFTGWVRILLGIWTVAILLLSILGTLWWLVLLALIIPAAAALRSRERLAKASPQLARLERSPAPLWFPIAAGVVTMVLSLTLAPAGTALYDSVALRGSTLQVEREQIEATLNSTRAAAGIDEVASQDAQYERGGVTREAVEEAEASVASLRFLDFTPALNACRRLQALNRFYTCQDADLDRYDYEGRDQTFFVFGREVDYPAIPDFQRRHFAFTHGKGVVMAPVNRIDGSGRPDFVVSGLPVTGLEQPLERPEIYFGAQRDTPFAIVNTDQPDGFTNQVPDTWEGAGVPVSGNRLAITLSQGGLPFIGGGRRLWNAIERSERPDSQLLLHRDITARMQRLAPYLVPDADPYFVVEDGRLWVMMNAYSVSDRYPYSARFDGRNYQRHAVTAIMDAGTGETKLYVMDPEDPVVQTWRKVYPALFTDREEMPESLAAHLRYGEDLFGYQSAAMGRFHVTDVDQFFNNDDAWAPTVETVGPGSEGQRIPSPARYTYARLPGSADERFLLVRYFKPATTGRGIGFSAWLAVDNDPERFGELSVLRFVPDGPSPLDSVDTFASNVGRDPELSAQIGVRTDQILRGNVIVVPIGQGLLYLQPLYLDTSADSLPTLWQVVVSLGDGRIFYAPTFRESLSLALAGQVSPDGDPDSLPSDLRSLVERAAAAYETYRTAWAAGNYDEAARALSEFERLLERAEGVATDTDAEGGNGAAGPAPDDPDPIAIPPVDPAAQDPTAP
ncbi:MAG: UPF0182 family protein [Miltoncostaeaceae bacterium]